MYLDLDFDKDECENKFKEHESILNQKHQEKNYFDRQSKPDASKFLLHETISSLKMKSQFQISKKQFFAKIGKDRPKITTSQTRAINVKPSPEKLMQQNSTSKNNMNTNSAYGMIRASTSASSLGSDAIVGDRKFEFSKKSNQMNSMSNTELVVESYGFHDKPELEEYFVSKKSFEDTHLSEPESKKLDFKGTSIFSILLCRGTGAYFIYLKSLVLISFNEIKEFNLLLSFGNQSR